MAVIFGAVADDDTGATDWAGMLADRGMRPIFILDEPWREDFERWTSGADAVVIGTASRSIDSAAAYEQTRRAVRLLRTIDPQVLQIKYSSTLNSTSDGNVGSSIDAAMDEIDEQFTIALPASPVNDGSTYVRYHSVGQQLLSDSPPRDPSLDPMTNSNVVAHLQAQTKRSVGLASSLDVKQGSARVRQRMAEMRSEGIEIAVLDYTSGEDLHNICEAISDMRLVTGSSALARYLPISWPASTPLYPKRRSGGRGFLVVAGSYSPTTRRQNAWLAAHNATVITLPATNLAAGIMPDTVLTPICETLATGGTCLIQTSADADAVHQQFQVQNVSDIEAGEKIARSLAIFVRDVISLVAPEGLIVAGGETSSTLSRVLGFGALAVGPNIEPGIPVAVTLAGPALPVVLKSGNFGTEGFYGRAIETIRSLEFQEVQ